MNNISFYLKFKARVRISQIIHVYTLKENMYFINDQMYNIVTFFISFRVHPCMDNQNECGKHECKVTNQPHSEQDWKFAFSQEKEGWCCFSQQVILYTDILMYVFSMFLNISLEDPTFYYQSF